VWPCDAGAERLDRPEPRYPEAGVGHHNRANVLGQQGVQSREECRLHLRAVLAVFRVHLFIDGQRAATCCDGRPQQVESPVVLDLAPIDDQYGLLRSQEPGYRRLIEPRPHRLDIMIAEQPVQPLERWSHSLGTRKVPGELHQGEAPSHQQGLHGKEEVTGVARIEARDDRAENLLQYLGRVHDEVPRGWSPQGIKNLVMRAVFAETRR
jgi:hypothetical protein